MIKVLGTDALRAIVTLFIATTILAFSRRLMLSGHLRVVLFSRALLLSNTFSSPVVYLIRSKTFRVSWRRGIFILQMSTLLVCEKLRDFSANEIELKTKSVCFDEIHANIRVKHTNSYTFQQPSVGRQKLNTL